MRLIFYFLLGILFVDAKFAKCDEVAKEAPAGQNKESQHEENKEEKDEAEAAPKEETKEEELPKEEPPKEELPKEEPPKEEPKKEEPPKEEPKKEEPPKEEPKKEEPPKENMDEKKSNLPKEIYPKDEWDDEEFTWEEGVVKPGFKRPCIVHRAILGSVERFAAILIEHFGGKWPFWINPKQVSICTVSDEVNDYTEKVYTELKLKGYQVEWDKSPATLQKKIRNAQLAQFNYIFVIGKDEVKDQCVDIRTREGERIGKYSMYKVFELFKSLEPQMSNEEKELKEKIFKSDKSDKIIEAENKLIYNLYLTGDEVAQEDKDLYKELENENILREEYPNLFKWKLLMKKNMTSS
jgi:threonyl-tRNA synthetase